MKTEKQIYILKTNDGFVYEAYFELFPSIILHHVSNDHKKNALKAVEKILI